MKIAKKLLIVLVLLSFFNIASAEDFKFLPIGLTFSEKGNQVIITDIMSNSTFAKTTLEKGAQVLKINNIDVKNLNSVKKILKDAKKDEPIAILFKSPKTGKIDVALGSVGLVGGIIGLNFTIILQIINFLVLMFLLYKFLYNPVLEMLDKRREQIKTDLETAKAEREKAMEMLEKYKKTLEEFNSQREDLLVKARQEAEKEKNELLQKARAESQNMINNAKLVIQKETEEAISKVKKEVGELVVEVTKTVLGEIVDDKLDQQIRKKVLEKVES